MRYKVTFLALLAIGASMNGQAFAKKAEKPEKAEKTAPLANIQKPASCAGKTRALGVSRVVALDTSLGQRFGRMQYKEDRLLGDREVILTFDDGPLPRYTKPILKALADHCTKATFFYVGKMAKAYPKMLKKVDAAGHTIAGHTYSHPLNLKRRAVSKAKLEIEKGFMTIEAILGKSIAPFFRFPGLSDSKPLMSYLRQRGIGMFSVDIVSNDSYTRNPGRLTRQTMRKLDKQGRGILLFHDIKASTARALPNILAQLKKKGYKVVHITGQKTFTPLVTDQKKLPRAIAKIPRKKWVSFQRLTMGPIPLPVKREAPVLDSSSATVVKSSTSGAEITGDDEDAMLEEKPEKTKGSLKAETHKTAELTTDSTDADIKALDAKALDAKALGAKALNAKPSAEPTVEKVEVTGSVTASAVAAKPVIVKIALPVKKPRRRKGKVKGWAKTSAEQTPFDRDAILEGD